MVSKTSVKIDFIDLLDRKRISPAKLRNKARVGTEFQKHDRTKFSFQYFFWNCPFDAHLTFKKEEFDELLHENKVKLI